MYNKIVKSGMDTEIFFRGTEHKSQKKDIVHGIVVTRLLSRCYSTVGV